jgi:hypothetical protein
LLNSLYDLRKDKQEEMESKEDKEDWKNENKSLHRR